jgi:oligopeptidase A
MPINNPLLAMGHDLPDYSQIKAEHIEPAISVLLEQATTALNHAAKLPDQPTWENLIAPLEQANEALGRAWGVVNHLTSVADYPELRAEHAKMLPQVTAFSSAFNQNIALYERYKKLQSSSAWDALSTAQKKDINNTLRSFRLGGAELSPTDKPIFAKIAQDLANYCKSYSDHILDATDHFIHLEKDDSHLQGLPPEVLTAAKDLALEKKLSGFAFSLHFPSYFPIQQLADHRPLRELM